MPHFEVHGGHVKRSRLLGACFSRRSVPPRGHLQSICSSSSGSSPQTDTVGIPLSGSQTASFVSKHIHKEAHVDRFVSREESWYCPAVDTMPLMSLRLTSRFSPFGKPQSLPDLAEPPAFGTIQQSQVVTLLSREKRRSLPVPTHPLQHVVY